MSNLEELEGRLKALVDEDGDSRYITDDDDLWSIAYDLLAALRESEKMSKQETTFSNCLAIDNTGRAVNDALEKENACLRAALELITHVHHNKEVHLGPHRASGLQGHCIACIAQVAQHGDGFHGVDVEDAGDLIQAELQTFIEKRKALEGDG